jgi:lysophospholipase L1-like esterase
MSAPVRRSLALLCLLGLALAPAAAAQEPLEVEVGQVRLAAPAGGDAALLAPVRYPIQLAGQRVELQLNVRGARGRRDRAIANAGPLRSPELRRGFTFVHEIALGSKSAGRLKRSLARGRSPKVTAYATAVLDMNRNGVAELVSEDRESQRLRRAGRRACAGVGHRRVRPGRQLNVSLPACGAPVRWRFDQRAENGNARIRNGNLVYRASQRFRGTESILLRGRVRGGGQVTAPVEIKVTRRDAVVLRAIGDSVTAGFGYYDGGREMTIGSLPSCKPAGTRYNDACSSNSTNTNSSQKGVAYAPDHGLANNVSWVAQWANAHGVTDFQNLAVTGSEPADWTAGGQFFATTKRVESEDPDYILTTMGANPLLADMLFGVDTMGCAIWSDVFGKYAECVEEAFADVELRANLERLYRELVDNTTATIYLMQYHLSVPSSALLYSATQIATMGALINREIASVAETVDPLRRRLIAIAPPHFDVGVTGTHPSAAGYAQMAAKVPAPR